MKSTKKPQQTHISQLEKQDFHVEKPHQMFSTYNDILPASSTTQLINNTNKFKHTSLVFPTGTNVIKREVKSPTNSNNKTKNKKQKQQQRTRFKPFRIPLEPMKEGHLMDPLERMFLEAIERGDRHTAIRCLKGSRPVNVNCTNMMGRSAIQIAVDNENIDLVELLLKQQGIKIGDALLYAVCEGVYNIVEMIIDHPSITPEMLGSDWGIHKSADGEETSDEYSPDVSPVIMAAHCNQFEILQLLLSRGARIIKPHPLSCSCHKCRKENMEDSLRHSLLRIQTYRALSSPAWISLTSSDPVLTAFRLSWELEHLAMKENEFKDLYANISEQCKKYACNLLDQCRSSEEVVAILNKPVDPIIDSWDTEWSDVEECDEEEDEEDDGGGDDNDTKDEKLSDCQGNQMRTRLTLDRFKLALKYRQKQFVAHPHCQQLLASIWYEGIPGWRSHNFLTKILIIVSLIGLLPVMALIYLVFPRSKLGRLVRTPFMKFMYHSVSFGVFLFLLILASTNVGSGGADQSQRQHQRGPPPTNLEWMIVVYVMGFVWAECKQLWEEGLKAYIRQWWNWLDFIMLSLYLCTLSLRLIAFFHSRHPEIYGPNISSRSEWPDADPTLVSEGVFAIANVFSFARIIYLFQANPQLGPLQISLGCMLIDIGKFFFIFFLVITSFACGLNQLYYFYSSATSYETNNILNNNNTLSLFSTHDTITSYLIPPSTTSSSIKNILASNRDSSASLLASTEYENAFDPLNTSFVTLFWTLFGIVNLDVLELKVRSVEGFGKVLFGLYNVAARILFLNMLIAMMSKSFNVIVDHADREWKFARSKLWMGYFDDGSTLPPPFNLIISPKSVLYIIRLFKWIIIRCCCSTCHHVPRHQSTYCHPKRTGHVTNLMIGRKKYDDVMRRLVSRFIHQWKKQLRQGGVNEDDMLEIKQDISSLRYELREDRKKGEFQLSFMLENLKKDIARLITCSIESRDRLNESFPVAGSSCTPSIHRKKESHQTSRNSSMEENTSFQHHHQHLHKSSASLSEDMKQMKMEVMNSLKFELKHLVREAIEASQLNECPIESSHHHHQPIESSHHHHQPIESSHHHQPIESLHHHHQPIESSHHHHQPIESLHHHHHQPIETLHHHHQPIESLHHHQPIESSHHHHQPIESLHHHQPIESLHHHHQPIESLHHHHQSDEALQHHHHHETDGTCSPQLYHTHMYTQL